MTPQNSASNPEANPIRVFLADSTVMSNQLLADALSRDPRFCVVGTAEVGDKALSGIRGPVDVGIVNGASAELASGLRLSRQLLAAQPDLRIVMLLERSERGAVIAAFRAGASGVFCRAEPINNLWKCIESVYAGKVWADDEQLRYVLEELANCLPWRMSARCEPCALTDREQMIVRLVAEGLTNREIAAELALNEHTLKSCLHQLFSKLNVSSRAEMVFAASAQAPPTRLDPIPPGEPIECVLDDEVRRDWFSTVAERGFPMAQLRVGETKLKGPVTKQDLVAAYAWFLLAAEGAQRILKISDAYRESLSARMTADQALQAKHKANEWFQRQRDSSRAGKGRQKHAHGIDSHLQHSLIA